jgi:adenylate kinase
MVPEAIVNQLVEQRLAQPDCRVNGFVLEGFPVNQSQLNHLTAMNANPSIIIQLDQTETEAVKRLSKRRIDPETGANYNINIDLLNN